MNFITYVNENGVFKSALIDYDQANETIVTKTSINENYLVTSVFIAGQKRLINNDDCLQTAVVNDNNFDGTLIELNHYNIEGTKFSAIILPLVSVGAGTNNSTTFNGYNYLIKNIFNPLYNNEANKDSDSVVYADFAINLNGDNNFHVTHYKFWDNQLGKAISLQSSRSPYGFNSTAPIGSIYVKSGKLGYVSMTTAERFVARIYVNMLKRTYHICVSEGTTFNPLNYIEATYNNFAQLQGVQSMAVILSTYSVVFQISDY